MSFSSPTIQSPPPPPPAPPPPATPASSGAQASYAQEQQKAAKEAGKGFGGTLLTGPQGAKAPDLAKQTLGS